MEGQKRNLEVDQTSGQEAKKPKVEPAPGVLAVFKMNKKQRFFLPSTQNFFGPVQVEQVMVDSGCNSILLPLQQGKLQETLDAFPEDKGFNCYFGISHGVSGQSAVLRIKARNPSEPILIKLAKDLFPNVEFKVKHLRFHLVQEDIESLRADSRMLARFEQEDRKAIQESKATNTERRKHALIGQSIMQQDDVSSLQHEGVCVLVRSSVFKPELWTELSRMQSILLRAATNLPPRFDDLEDEDHDPNDEEDDRNPELSDSDFYDE